MDYELKIVCRARVGMAEQIAENMELAFMTEEQYSLMDLRDYFFNFTVKLIDEKEQTTQDLLNLIQLRLEQIINSIVKSTNPLYISFPQVLSSSKTKTNWGKEVQRSVTSIFINRTHYFNPKIKQIVVTTKEDSQVYVSFKDYMLHQNEIYSIETDSDSVLLELRESLLTS